MIYGSPGPPTELHSQGLLEAIEDIQIGRAIPSLPEPCFGHDPIGPLPKSMVFDPVIAQI